MIRKIHNDSQLQGTASGVTVAIDGKPQTQTYVASIPHNLMVPTKTTGVRCQVLGNSLQFFFFYSMT